MQQTRPNGVASGPGRLTRYGRGWRVEVGARTTVVDHLVGMYHLAVLIADPGTEIPAAELVDGVGAVSRLSGTRWMSRQAVLDVTAVREYRERLAELPDDGERDWLVAELSANSTPGGGARTFTDSSERARLAVGR